MQQRIKKEKIGISISPNLKREAEQIMSVEEIPTLSDFISQAVTVYIDRYKREQKANVAKRYEAEPIKIVHEIE